MQLTPRGDGKILAGSDGPVGHLVFNNPERSNAISLDMWQQATTVLEELANDDAIRLVVFSGAGGKAFAAGADISKFDTERDSADAVRRYGEISKGFYRRVKVIPKPTIARIEGYCIGGGLVIASCCDIRICHTGSRFALPAARLGLGYGFSEQKHLADIVGLAHMPEILFTARQFTAQEAKEMGLVNRVLAPDEIGAFVDDYAARIAENAPMTISLAKAGKIAMMEGVDDQALARLRAMADACYASEDYKEGRAAFKHKRKPNFVGR
jgi:enoyl-CoA hydratase